MESSLPRTTAPPPLLLPSADGLTSKALSGGLSDGCLVGSLPPYPTSSVAGRLSLVWAWGPHVGPGATHLVWLYSKASPGLHHENTTLSPFHTLWPIKPTSRPPPAKQGVSHSEEGKSNASQKLFQAAPFQKISLPSTQTLTHPGWSTPGVGKLTL